MESWILFLSEENKQIKHNTEQLPHWSLQKVPETKKYQFCASVRTQTHTSLALAGMNLSPRTVKITHQQAPTGHPSHKDNIERESSRKVDSYRIPGLCFSRHADTIHCNKRTSIFLCHDIENYLTGPTHLISALKLRSTFNFAWMASKKNLLIPLHTSVIRNCLLVTFPLFVWTLPVAIFTVTVMKYYSIMISPLLTIKTKGENSKQYLVFSYFPLKNLFRTCNLLQFPQTVKSCCFTSAVLWNRPWTLSAVFLKEREQLRILKESHLK